MTGQLTFVPTPRLEYTRKYNENKEDYQRYLDERQREIDREERLRLEKFQEEQRMLDKRLLVKELEDVKMYAVKVKEKEKVKVKV